MILFILLFSSFSHTIFDNYQVSKMVDQNNWDVVQNFYENEIKNDPRNAHALFSAGVAAFKQEDLDRARSLFSRAAEIDQSLQEKSLFNVGNIEMIGKKYQEALDAYEAVLKINPENTRARERAELARQLLQQPPEQDQQDQKNDDSKDSENNQQDKPNESNSSQDDKKQDKSDSSSENADDKSQNRNQDDKKQEKNEKGQGDRHKDNKKPDQQGNKNEGQREQEKTERQAADEKKEKSVESKNNKGDHTDKHPQKDSQDQSKEIDPKDQWKARLFSALDKIEEDSHKDMMQVVYAKQAPQDQTSHW